MEGFSRKRVGQKVLAKEKDCSGQGLFPFEGKARGLIMQMTLSSCGNGQPLVPDALVMEDVLTGLVRQYFWQRLKLQLNQILSPSLGTRAK